jgi:hypothetical protein
MLAKVFLYVALTFSSYRRVELSLVLEIVIFPINETQLRMRAL